MASDAGLWALDPALNVSVVSAGLPRGEPGPTLLPLAFRDVEAYDLRGAW
ncbi:hypothetical protein I4I73_22030 [Pseudonocardia sp. KRD-184]|uniref:Uncharacterized protein n=1 Tax=Pseudonocardia oceani TaxID=2792013 RepID=A0ABS6U2N3_9PSEU|nr:hypothetical protein [Pseudonocardia oceani]MBW0092871.1 hypothetical protein [Pseudonocardia oceani]MBW0098670.1 hypothetical protein [Pseudonocardia oceani]MBW0121963.1 hypothetical protein [Pseudonocardia oceani]MBW0126483.1 hypothetical protein [Pseudonocardia oceani]